MSYAASDIISQAQSKLNDASFSSADLLQYVNNANRDVHNELELTYMQSTQNYSAVIGQSLLGTLPTDLQQIYSLRLTDTNYARKLPFWTFNRFDERYPQPSIVANGTPFLWYAYSGNAYLFAYPDRAYGLQLRYLKKPTTLADATGVPNIPEEFQNILFLSAMAQAMEKRDRYDVAQFYWGRYEDMKLELSGRYSAGSDQIADPYVVT